MARRAAARAGGIALATLAILLVALALQSNAMTPVERLHMDGQRLQDGLNRTVLLRGQTVEFKGTAAEESAREWAQQGVNLVRLVLDADEAMAQEDAIKLEYWRQVRRQVRVFSKQDQYVLIAARVTGADGDGEALSKRHPLFWAAAARAVADSYNVLGFETLAARPLGGALAPFNDAVTELAAAREAIHSVDARATLVGPLPLADATDFKFIASTAIAPGSTDRCGWLSGLYNWRGRGGRAAAKQLRHVVQAATRANVPLLLSASGCSEGEAAYARRLNDMQLSGFLSSVAPLPYPMAVAGDLLPDGVRSTETGTRFSWNCPEASVGIVTRLFVGEASEYTVKGRAQCSWAAGAPGVFECRASRAGVIQVDVSV